MGRASAAWRRVWGIRPGGLRPPVSIVGRGRTMGETESGPRGRGWSIRHRRLRQARRAEAVPAPPVPEAVDFPVTVVGDAEIGDGERAHALAALGRVARHAGRPVLHARVVLRRHSDPALERPAVAKASLDVEGRPVRAHVAAGQLAEAIDLLEERLRRNVDDLAELERARRRETGVSGPGEWRHGSLPTARPDTYPRPPGERELVRRKTYALSALTPEEAALELGVLDHDFHLFTDADSGEECVAHRLPDGGVALLRTTSEAQRRELPFPVDPAPAPAMLLEDAIERLAASGERFVFFVDAQTRRGMVLYLRYDGHYGLIEPA